MGVEMGMGMETRKSDEEGNEDGRGGWRGMGWEMRMRIGIGKGMGRGK